MKYVIVCLIFLSCKVETKKEIVKIEQNNFEIHIDAIVPIDDVFEIFYLNEDLSKEVKFSEKQKIRKNIIGSKIIQRITFKLPEHAQFYQFRVDLGNNKNQKEITIKSITLSNMNNSILINTDLIKIFFLLNKFIDLNDFNGKMKFKHIKQKKDPYIIAKPILIKKIELEL